MKKVLSFLALIAVVACEAREAGNTDSAPAATPAAAAAPTPITYADVAGKWSARLMPEVGDSVLMTYEVNATADSTGWTTTFPGRPPVPMHVMPPSGDSIVAHMGPYESALRKGVQVNSTIVVRLKDGKMVGNAEARYSTAPDSVVRFRMEGTRM